MKGSVLDMIFIPIILLVIGISVYVGSLILSQITPNLAATSQSANNTLVQAKIAINTFNWTFLLIAFAFGIGSIIFAFMYPSHPIFFVFGLVILIFSMITTPMISNVFETFSTSSTFASVTTNFPIINWLMINMLPIFMTITGFLMLIVLYTNIRGGRE